MTMCRSLSHAWMILVIITLSTHVHGQLRRSQMSQKQCLSGRTMRCIMAPCDYQKCNSFATAECRNNYCDGCTAEFWMGANEVTTQCDQISNQVAPNGLPGASNCPMRCFANPCTMAKCNGRTSAECRPDNCNCKATFWEGSTEVTSMCQDDNVGLSKGGLQDKIRTAQVTSRKPCVGQSMMNCQTAPCLTSRCDRFPNAQCRNNYCGGCSAEFWDGLREVTSECSNSELSMSRQAGVASRKSCVGQASMNCQTAPCLTSRCDSYPNAQCRNNYCGGCNAEFWDGQREVTLECSNAELGLSQGGKNNDVRKPMNLPVANSCPNTCLFSPCLFGYCSRFPQAQCSYDTCKGCVAQYTFNGQDVTSRCKEQAPGFRGLGGFFSRFRQPRRRNFMSPWYAFLDGLF